MLSVVLIPALTSDRAGRFWCFLLTCGRFLLAGCGFLLVSFTFLFLERAATTCATPHCNTTFYTVCSGIINNLYIYTAAQCCYLILKKKQMTIISDLNATVSHRCVLSLHCAGNLSANVVWWMMICLPLKVINQTVPAKWIPITSISLMCCNVCRCWVWLITITELQMS